MKDERKKTLGIILADDDPHILFFLKYSFEQAGICHEINCFTSGEQLLEFLAGHASFQKPVTDCLILDLNMPGKNGRETLEEIQAKNLADGIPVVVMSNQNHPPDVEAMMRLGVTAFWEKPARLEHYKILVEKIVSLTSEFSGSKN